ncbi:MAG: exodeoxyribonuclease III [Deltaproteobacteria bacterium]|nr:exodeoxyribonuclease III [Deltaproteobacteria bacterium]MBW2017987.1 exodeoxyribonuclease III [Deltaproteobacteria bacterium]MBW2130765.1 exodeoxyribonuclease III [Deltaproteobacteria bacterium]MBW2302611.1 exodeoxyribonuclease III [Deltaproteobacteria bacterium]
MPFTIATFNTNSIRARLPILLDWLKKRNPDLLCLQETKVQDKDFPAGVFEEIGYRTAFRGQKAYNGVALVSRHPLEGIRRDLHEEGDSQARFISTVVRDIPVVNVYVPQGYAVGTDKFEYKLRWLKDLFAHIRTTYDPGRPLLVAGDFNIALEDIDVYDPDAFRGEVCFHPDEQSILREFLDWGLVDIFRKHEPGEGHYTFWDYRIPNALKRKMGWRIDYILATAPLAERSIKAWVDTAARLKPKPSDHTFLVAEFE